MKVLATLWNVLALGVHLFALWVAFALVTGRLDPSGSPYYGVVWSLRMAVLLALLAAFQALWTIDAVVLGRRLKRGLAWVLLGLGALVGPFSLVTTLGQLDAWRFAQRSAGAALLAGAAMALVIVAVTVLRTWAYRRTAPGRGRPE